jgi:hypothetical protein
MKTNTASLIPAALCASSLLAAAGQPEPAPIITPPAASPWEFRLTPYAWLTAIDGTNGPSAEPAEVDASFSDIADVLDMAAALQFEARHGRWGFLADGFYSELGASGTSKGPAQADVDISFEQFIGELEVMYRVADCPDYFVDVYAGLRYTKLQLDLDIEGTGPLDLGREVSADRDWADPIIGLRSQWNLNERWFLAGKGDIGGFGVSSDFTWNVQASVGYNFTEMFSMELGYRYFDTDYEDSGFTYDIAQFGLLLNANFRF